jgi:hypothetical protein
MYIPTLYLSPESYEVNSKAGLLAYPVPAAFPIRFIRKSGEGAETLLWTHSCGYSSRFSAGPRQITGFPFHSFQRKTDRST